MKKILALLTIIIVCVDVTKAQAPQGLNYQAVAYNASGTPVLNQAISVRLSILDGSATGTTVYQETQNPTTDNTGLFSIVIGNGVVVSGTFASINWGNGSKWLKTEIDITGGTNYLVMGTSQFMSVPYALYAEKTGYAERTANNISMPDALINSTPIVIQDNTDYTVPSGKNLYFFSAKQGIPLIIDNDSLYGTFPSGSTFLKTPIGASAGSIVRCPQGERIGILVDKTVDWKTIDIYDNPLVVPANKKFIIVNESFGLYGSSQSLSDYNNCKITFNGLSVRAFDIYGGTYISNMVLDEGTTLSTIGCSGFSNPRLVINGYFINK